MVEDIRNTGPDIPQEVYLSWRSVAEDFELDHLPQKRGRMQSSVQEYFDTVNTPTRDISGVIHSEENNYIIIEVGESQYYFDIYSEQFCGNIPSEANEFREQNPSPEVEIILTGVPVLQEIMNRNYNDGYIGSFLNNNDRADFECPEMFQNMTARELQMTLRGNIRIFENNGGLLGIDEQQRENIVDLYRSYLEIVMGIGDRYEQGSHFFHKTESEIDLYLRSTIYSFESTQECIDYYVYIQTEIYNNSRSSKSNKQAYKIFSQKLGVLVYERLRRDIENEENPEQQQDALHQAVEFINIITERSDIEINNDLRNPQLAEEICIYILSREGGVLDTLESCTRYNLDFSDPIVGNRRPIQVVTQTEERLRQSGFENPRLFLRSNFGIDARLLVGTEEDSYEELSLDHKRQISLLARLIQKIDTGDLSPDVLSHMDAHESQAYITELGQEITQEAYAAVTEAYDRNFDSDSYGGRPIYIPPNFIGVLENIGVQSVDIDTLRLFNDIRGHDVRGWNGFMNFSDENINLSQSLTRSAGIIIGTIAVVMLATALTGGVALPALAQVGIGQALIASGGGLTMAGSLTSIGVGATLGTAANIGIFDPRTHDSFQEALGDVGSDFIINTFHAIYMERLTMQLWNTTGTLGRTGLIGGDLGSGVGIEVLRENMINRIFHREPLLGDMHHMSIREAFWGANYQGLEEYLTPELEARFQAASHIHYLWNGYDFLATYEPEFQNIDWLNGEEIFTALEAWIVRQEQRV